MLKLTSGKFVKKKNISVTVRLLEQGHLLDYKPIKTKTDNN